MRMLTDVLDDCQRENRRLEASLAALTEEREGLRAALRNWQEAYSKEHQQLQALTAAHERVRAVLADWRDHLQHPRMDAQTPGFLRGMRECANTLDEALASPEGTPHDKGDTPT